MEVHPPDHALHSWRDFLIHMGTITLGLLIALGLESMAELYHMHHRVNETRDALAEELKTNVRASQGFAIELRREALILNGDLQALQYLKAHPGTKLNELPAPLYWSAFNLDFQDSAWKTAQQTGMTAQMPVQEVMQMGQFYGLLNKFSMKSDAVWEKLNAASSYDFGAADATQLTPAQLDEAIRHTEEALAEHYMACVYLMNVSEGFAAVGFKPTITRDDLMKFSHHVRLDDLGKVFGPAGDRTRDEVKEYMRKMHEADNQKD